MKRWVLIALVLIVIFPLSGMTKKSSMPNIAPRPTQVPDSSFADKFWQQAEKEIYKPVISLQFQQYKERNQNIFYTKLMRGDPEDKKIALTFDDGPHPKFTPQILAVLKKYHIKATFFVVGRLAEQYPDLIKSEAAAGNLVGNHTYDHVMLTKLTAENVQLEWQTCSNVLKSIIGKPTHFCRPPGGDYNHTVITAAMKQRLTTVLWTDDPGDYASPGDSVILDRTLGRVENGGIILLHDGVQQTIDVLPQIIQTLQKRGYKFVRVDEMVQDKSSLTSHF